MKRRLFLKNAVSGAGVAAAAGTLATPALSQGTKRWRLQTTWPKNFPGLGTGANRLAEYINNASGGRLTVEVYGAGDVVPAFETIDAVSSGTLEMGHGAPYYWKNRVPAAQFIASVPFGMNVLEQNAWMTFAGGHELADEIYQQMGCKFFPSGNTGMQMGGWFNREVSELSDFKGLTMRIPGLGGEIVKAAGGNVINLPGGEIPGALASGKLDATEWVGPYNDLAFGLQKVTKNYYYPGWHEPATVLDNFINIQAWESLSSDLQGIVAAANAHAYNYVLSEYVANNTAALKALTDKYDVKLKKFSDKILNGFGKLSGQVIGDLASQDPLSRKVMDSIVAFRGQALTYSKVTESAFYKARGLPFGWVK